MYKIVILVHSLFLPIFQTDFDMSKDFKSKWRSKVDDKTVAGLSRHSCTSIQFDIMTTSVMLKQWVLYILTITMALSNKDKPKWVCLVLVLFFFFYCHCLSSHSTCSFHEPWGAARWATGASLVPASPKLPFSIWSLINCASAAAPGANFYLPFHCCVLSMQRLFIYHLMLQHPAGFVVAAFHLQRH